MRISSEVGDAARACPGCGSSVGDERFCGACGSPIPQFHIPSPPPVAASAREAPARSTVVPKPVEQRPAPTGAASNATTDGSHCDLCGASPAIAVSFQQGVGLLFTRRAATTAGTLCRDCGQSLGRQAANRTLWTGWWGVISFFSNFAYIFTNARGLLRLNRLPRPQGASGYALNPGKGLFARSGVWFAVVLALVGIGALSSESDDGYSDYSPPAFSEDNISPDVGSSNLEWEVGACVRIGVTDVELVNCSSSYEGRIVKEASSSDLCPYSAEIYVEDRFTVYCIDEY